MDDRGAGGDEGRREPERTCVGCGRRAPWSELVRLVRRGETVSVDPGGGGGRGAWLHPAEECLARAVRRKAFARGFRAPVQADPEHLRRQLTASGGRD